MLTLTESAGLYAVNFFAVNADGSVDWSKDCRSMTTHRSISDARQNARKELIEFIRNETGVEIAPESVISREYGYEKWIECDVNGCTYSASVYDYKPA